MIDTMHRIVDMLMASVEDKADKGFGKSGADFRDIYVSYAATLGRMVLNSTLGKNYIHRAMDTWIGTLSSEDKIRACQIMYDNVPSASRMDSGRKILLYFCNSRGIPIRV